MKLILLPLFIVGYVSCSFSQPSSGKASYYANSLAGRSTASGEKYQPDKFTAAHKTLPFGTRLEVTNLKNQKKVVVTVNDRGPFIKGRIIDLSWIAAKQIGLLNDGITEVSIVILRSENDH